MATTAGETLVEAARNATAEVADAAPEADSTVVESTPQETKPVRRPRKPREQAAELADAPVDTPVDDTPATEAGETPEWMQRLQSEAGFQNLSDPNDAANRAIDMLLQKQREAQELADWRRQNEPFVGYGREYIAQRPNQPEAKPTEQPKPWQPPVSYPDAVSRYVVKNEETGAPDWKPDTPSEVRAQAEKFLAWRDGLIDMLTTRPDKFLSEVIVPLIREEGKNVVEPFYEERTQQQREQEFFGTFARENAEWLYARDPQTGKPTQYFSQAGQTLNELIGELRKDGMPYDRALRVAQLEMKEQLGGVAPWEAAAPDPLQTREQKKREHNRKPLNGAGSVAQRNGSFTEPEVARPQNGNVGFGQSFLDRARREGMDLKTIAST